MTNDKEWQRPKKPYTVTVDKAPQTYVGGTEQNAPTKPAYEKRPYHKKPFSRAKPVVVTSKNNENNKFLHDCLRQNLLLKISINNLLCSDDTLIPTYTGRILRFDDFTILFATTGGSYLINKSSIAVLQLLEPMGETDERSR